MLKGAQNYHESTEDLTLPNRSRQRELSPLRNSLQTDSPLFSFFSAQKGEKIVEESPKLKYLNKRE